MTTLTSTIAWCTSCIEFAHSAHCSTLDDDTAHLMAQVLSVFIIIHGHTHGTFSLTRSLPSSFTFPSCPSRLPLPPRVVPWARQPDRHDKSALLRCRREWGHPERLHLSHSVGGSRPGSRQRVANLLTVGNLDTWWKVCLSNQHKNPGGKGKGKKGKDKGTDRGIKGNRSESTKSLPGTQNTANCWRSGNAGPCARDGRSIAHVGECERLVKMTGPGTRHNGTNCNLNLKRNARLEVCGCVLSVVKRTRQTLTWVQELSELTLDLKKPWFHLTQRITITESVAQRKPCDIAQENQWKTWVTSVLWSRDGPHGNTFAKTTVAPVQKNLSSFAALVDTGHEVAFQKRSIVRVALWQHLRERRQDARNDKCALEERFRDAVAREQEFRGEAIPEVDHELAAQAKEWAPQGNRLIGPTPMERGCRADDDDDDPLTALGRAHQSCVDETHVMGGFAVTCFQARATVKETLLSSARNWWPADTSDIVINGMEFEQESDEHAHQKK